MCFKMKRITNNLDNQNDLSRITNALRSVLNNKDFNVEVVIQERKDGRRQIQNRLMWHWYDELGKQDGLHGMTLQELINYNKLTIGVKILQKSNPEFSEKLKQFTVLSYEQKLGLMEFMPITSIMKVCEMAEYLTDFKLHWNQQGAVLTDINDMMNKAL